MTMRLFIDVIFMVAISAAAQINNLNLSSAKRTDDRWIWDYVDLSEAKTTETGDWWQICNTEGGHSVLDSHHNYVIKPPPTTSSYLAENNLSSPRDDMDADPCAPFEPKKPELRNKEQKISEIKCSDYIWDTQVRAIRQNRSRACDYKNGIFVISVIGGQAAGEGEFPHLAAIGWKGVDDSLLFKCGGSLISEDFVLTAAHCTSSPADTQLADTVPKVVRLGTIHVSSIFSGRLNDINIKSIVKHPKYKSPRKYFDIALLQLEKAVQFDNLVRPACLWTKADVDSIKTPVSVAGWGVLQEKGLTGAEQLQRATIELIDSKTCNALLMPYRNRLWDGLDSSQICAGNLSGGVDVCQGDSGGPLQVEIELPPEATGYMYRLLGVTAFGIGCARANSPGVYTRVSSFIDWIEQIVWPSIKM